MRKTITAAAIAAAALIAPAGALAHGNKHIDGPAQGAIPAICHSKPGQAWANQQMAVAKIYWQAFLTTGNPTFATLAQRHLVYVEWHNAVCAEGPVGFGY